MVFNQQEFNSYVLENDVIGLFEQPITLKSGRISNWYVNWRNVAGDVFLLDKLTDFVISFVKEKGIEVDTFYGVPEGATKLAVLTQFKWAKSLGNLSKGSHVLAMGRAVPKQHGAVKDKFFVGMPQGRTVVIEDVTTTGGSLLDTVDSLKQAGVNVVAVLSLTNRMEKRDDGTSVKEAVEEKGVPFFSLSNSCKLLPQLFRKLGTDQEIIKIVKEYFEKYGVEKLSLDENIESCKKEVYNLTEKEQLARQKICLPLDGLNTLDEVRARVEELAPLVGLFKIGGESYTRFGPEVVRIAKEHGANVFLDLKYHDIPNTVKGAAKAAAELGVYMFNVHASGGLEMMQAAKEGAREGANNSGNKIPLVIGVTILTSINQQMMSEQLRIQGRVDEQVLHLAKLSHQAGLDGIVCSAADLSAIKNALPGNFVFVTPGIKGPFRPAGYDQKRVFTPGNAIQEGSSILVIGRAIRRYPTAEERKRAAHEVLQDMAKYL